MKGRWPRHLSLAMDAGEENVALAIHEQEQCRETIARCDRAKRTLTSALADGRVDPDEHVLVMNAVREVRHSLIEQLKLDRYDERVGRNVNSNLTLLAQKRREAASEEAAPQQPTAA